MDIINVLHWDANPYARGLKEELVAVDQIPGEGFQVVNRETAESKPGEKIDISSNIPTTDSQVVIKGGQQPETIYISHEGSQPNKTKIELVGKSIDGGKPETIDLSHDPSSASNGMNSHNLDLHPTAHPHNAAPRNFDFWDSLVKPLETSSSRKPIRGASDIGVSAVLTSLGITLVLFVLILAIYEVCFRLFPSVYNSKKSSKRDAELQQPVMMPRTWVPLGWIPSVMRVPWSQVRRIGGLESYLYLRYIRMCLQIAVVSAFWGLVLLFPIYGTGGNHATGFYHVSASNLVQGSMRLWAPTIFMWLLTMYVLYVMHEEYKHYVECRMEFLARDPQVHPKQRYTLIVEEVPHELRSDKALYDYFNALFPGKVHSASMVLRIPDLEALVAERNRVVRRLEKCRTIQDVTGKRMYHVVGRRTYNPLYSGCGGSKQAELYDEDGSLPKGGEKVESVKYFTRYLAILNDRVARMQAEKQGLASKGDHSIRASQWISHALGLASDAAVTTLTGRQRGDDDLILDFGRGNGFGRALKSFFVDFFCSSFSSVHRQIDKMVETVSVAPISSTGFVTFEDLVTVTCAVRAPLSHEAGVLTVKMAPDPRDIRWESAHVHLSWIVGREGVTNTLLGLGAILWSFPVAAIQALSSAKSLSELPFFLWLDFAFGTNVSNLIIGYLPVIALLAIIALLPTFFRSLATNYEQRKTYSDVQQSVLTRFFYYQLANIFVTMTAGSLLDSLSEIIAHPSSSFAILAETVPTVVGYFVMLLLTLIFVALPLKLLRLPALFNALLLKLSCKEKYLTPREVDEMYSSQSLDTGYFYPYHLLVVVIAFTYAVIAPVILPVAAVYFLGSFIVFKKQILFAYTTQYESGGKSFSSALNRTLVGLICGQVTLIGYTVLRAGLYQPLVLLPLPFYSAYMMYAFVRLYEGPGSYLSLEKATALDRERDLDAAIRLNEEVYRQPALIESNVQPMVQRTEDEDSGKSSNSSGTQPSVKTV